jgi:ribosome-associated toxin RatA of RatAB toxin-antitoxin module
VADKPVIAHGYEHIAVAAVMVEADLGENHEIASHPRFLWRHVGKADVGDVVAHDPLHARRCGRRAGRRHDSSEKVNDRVAPADRLGAPQLELAVLAKGLSKVVESQRVTRPVIASQCVSDAFTSGQLPKLHASNRKPAIVAPMATSDSREVVIEASPEEILDVIADVESTPTWSPQYQSAEVLDAYDNGKPKRVKMKIKTAGISDEQVVEYTWSGDVVSWTLVSAGQLKSQEASYTLTPDGDKTKVRFDIAVDLSVPLPGFILKRAMKGGVETATDGLRKQVLKVKKGGK